MASIYPGRGAALGFAEETTWGTFVAPTNWLPVLPGASLRRNISKVQRNVLSVSNAVNIQRGHFTETDNVTGGLLVNFNYQTCGLLLKHILGANVTTGGPTNYVHTLTLAAEPPTGLSMSLRRGPATASSEPFEGCKINRATFSRAAGGLLTLSLDDIIGETSTARIAAVTPSYGAAQLNMAQFARPVDTDTLTWDGNTYVNRSWSITVDNNLARRPQNGAVTTLEPTRNGPISVTMSVTLEVDDVIYADNIADTESDLSILVSKAAGITELDTTLHNAYLEDVSDPVAGPGLILQTLSFKAQADGTDDGLKMILRNQQATVESNS